MQRAANIELFSCSGGMAEGFRRAGIGFDFVFDYDSDACESYSKNLRHFPIRMDVRDLVRMARGGWRPGPMQLLVADPPCTPWSRAGKRLGTEDERDMLEETAELIALLKPRAYLIGNVPGLQDSTSWNVVQRVIGGLSKFGYCVADYTTLDAADYGVPQHRIRPFWYGHRDGPCVRWPAPTHGDPSHPALPGLELKPWVTCRAALSHLPIEELGRPVRLKRADTKHPASAADEPGTVVRATDGGGNAKPHLGFHDAHRPNLPDEPSQTMVAKVCQVGSQLLEWPWDRPATTIHEDPRLAPPGHHEASFLSPPDTKGSKKKRPPSTKGPQWSRTSEADAPAPAVLTDGGRTGGNGPKLNWPWSRPSTTVCAGIDKIAPPEEHAGHLGPNAVVLSERAAAILQGFPESWTFHGKTKKARWAQIGMAMPPPLAEAVARSIRAAMETGHMERESEVAI